jgi:hypothetical protein
MVYACFLACSDYAVLALISFLPYAPITVEPICFERTFKIINIYHHHLYNTHYLSQLHQSDEAERGSRRQGSPPAGIVTPTWAETSIMGFNRVM